MVGGAISHARGGNFGHGFWAAGLNQAIGGADMTSNPVANVAISAVIGGTISKVTGGKFANGASSAAFAAALRQDWGGTRNKLSQARTRAEQLENFEKYKSHPELEAFLKDNPELLEAFEDAWRRSQPNGGDNNQHEQGLWVYQDNETGKLTIKKMIDLDTDRTYRERISIHWKAPEQLSGQELIISFHTHPRKWWQHPYNLAPTGSDFQTLDTLYNMGFTNVRGIIRTHEGYGFYERKE